MSSRSMRNVSRKLSSESHMSSISTQLNNKSELALACESEVHSALSQASESPQLEIRHPNNAKGISLHLISSMTESSELSHESVSAVISTPSMAEQINTSRIVQTLGDQNEATSNHQGILRGHNIASTRIGSELSPRFNCTFSPAKGEDEEDVSVQASIVFQKTHHKQVPSDSDDITIKVALYFFVASLTFFLAS